MAQDKEEVVIPMTKFKDTTNTARFNADEDDAAIGNVYIRKEVAARLGNEIEIVIRPV